MQEVTRVAAAQVSPVFMNKEGTIEKACRTIEEAGNKKVDLIVFPETFVPGYPYWRGILPISRWSELMVEYQKNAIAIPSGDTDRLCESARSAGTHCVVGCTEISDRPGSGTLYNTLLFIDDAGRILGRHRKLMPTHGERMVWGLGDASDIDVFNTKLGRLGGLICYEHHMTLLKAAMAGKGEEIHCAVWPGWWTMEKHPGNKRRPKPGSEALHQCDVDYAIREYAFETQTFVISVGQYIPEDTLPEECRPINIAAGGSAIVNPAGLYLAGPALEQETVLYATLDADERRATKAYFDAVGHYARPDLMRLRLKRISRRRLRDRELPSPELDEKLAKDLAEKYGLDPQRVPELLREYERFFSRRVASQGY